jgi:hypothetical protein
MQGYADVGGYEYGGEGDGCDELDTLLSSFASLSFAFITALTKYPQQTYLCAALALPASYLY